MKSLARANPTNALLQGRGQPGTHDVQLGTQILQALCELNKSPNQTVMFPIYDKSAFDGQGDRSAQQVAVKGPVDIVLFEGWCLGYLPLSKDELQEKLSLATDDPRPAYCSYTVDELYAVSQQLKIWEREWFHMIDAMIQCTPDLTGDESLPSLVYTWRLEAEHNMKLVRGGQGMSDEQVKSFVQR
ncbi:glycerate 3-kinase [Malassezia yamatoensis]|uniref:Glycerate 3-kinase n=1 Tax=Malassezia yamatoensis TaxID=253288 RepID=A0AAJ5YS88_9BASI|nr:glycerate 3-kinase [Malassezia yamatoensis]